MTNCSKPNDFRPNGIKPSDHLPPRPLRAAYVPILLSEIEQEQRPSGNGDREAIVVGAGLCAGEGERAYTAHSPHYIFASRTNVFSCLEDVSATKTFRSKLFCSRYRRRCQGGKIIFGRKADKEIVVCVFFITT